MSIFPLFRLWLLCLSERRAEASLSSSPPTHFYMRIFYLCLCRLVCASLPILPSMLFSLLLVGKPLYGWACSPQLNWIVGTHKRSNTWQVFVQFLPGLDFDSFGQSTRLQDFVVAWWPLRQKEGQNRHPGRHRAAGHQQIRAPGRLQWMRSSRNKPTFKESENSYFEKLAPKRILQRLELYCRSP